MDDRSRPAAAAPVAALIGSGPMPVKCAELLVRAGFRVAAVHSPDEFLRDWAAGRGADTRFLTWFAEFEGWCRTARYDYLFSVVNFRLLEVDLIRSAGRLAVNYHDAPLPRYAGSHATAWALHNGEPEHGITWHVIEERVDAGDILKQTRFPLSPGETRQSLDLKCYLAALRAFRELAEELKSGTYTRTPQDLSRRTFYRRSDLPPDGAARG